MSQPDYEHVVERLDRIVAKVDKAEERARGGSDNGLWRQLWFLRGEVRKLRGELTAGQAPGETASAEGDSPSV